MVKKVRNWTVKTKAIIAVLVAAIAVSLVFTVPALASVTTGNPWTFQEDNPSANGLEIRSAGGPNGQLFQVFDDVNGGQPIVAVNEAGGFGVYGDNSGVFQGDNIWTPWVQMSIADPVTANCSQTNQIGSMVWGGSRASGGKLWKCQRDGSGHYAWIVKIS